MPPRRRATPAPIKNKGPGKPLLGALSAWTDGEDVPTPAPPPPPNRPAAGLVTGVDGTVVVGGGPPAQSGSYRELSTGAEGEGDGTAAQTPKGFLDKAKDYFDVEKPEFNMFVGVIVLLNAVVIGLETDLGKERFLWVEHIFVVIFLLEMIIRIRHYGFRNYITDGWHIFDCTLLGIGILDLWIVPLTTMGKRSSHGLANVTAFRLLRILRVLRVLRIVRLLRMFSTLYLLTRSIGKALQVVLSLSVLIAIVDYVLAIFLTQVVGQRAHEWAEDDSERVKEWFGTIGKSMRTLFQIMTLDGWSEVVTTLCEVLPPFVVVVFFICYITFASYTLVSLVTAVLCSSLIQAQAEGKETRTTKLENYAKYVANELRDTLLEQFDEKDKVDAEELKMVLKGDAVLFGKLEDCEINIGETGVLALVDQLTDKEEVSIDHFVEKLINLSNPAKASSVIDLKHKVKNLELKIDLILEKLDHLPKKA